MDCGVGEWSFDSLVKGWSRDESLHDLRDSVGRCWWLPEASLGLVGGQASLESVRLWGGVLCGLVWWCLGGAGAWLCCFLPVKESSDYGS